MDPITLSMIMSGIFGGLGGLFGGNGSQGQQKASFENESGGGHSLDPRNLLGQGLSANDDAMRMFTDRLAQGYELPGAYAQSPPSFSGGGLPMPIGLTGRDPALDDPARHLTIPGVQMRKAGGGSSYDLLGGLPNGSQRLPTASRPDMTLPPNAGGPDTPGHPSDTREPQPPYQPNDPSKRPRTAYDPKQFDSARAALDLLGVN